MLIPLLATILVPVDATPSRPPLLQAAIACRAIGDESARLACYDRTIAALDQAERDKDVVIVDRADVRRTQKSLFGMKVDRTPLMGDDLPQLDTTLQAASVDDRGNWVFTVADGAHWRKTDDNPVIGKPSAGDKVVIRRGALGSFRMSLNGRGAFKVRREL